MRVKFPTADPYGVFRWLEENIGLYGHGWKIIYKEDTYGTTRFDQLDIDSEEDVLMYKMVYNV